MSYRRMDAVEYLRAFTDEQLAMMCAQYDRRINSLDAENKQLQELVRDMLRRYYRPFLAEDADRQLARRAEELGVEV